MTKLSVCTPEDTARLLPYPQLIEAIAQAARDLAAGAIEAPVRQMVPYPGGGVMLSMPATAADAGVHKLVNVVPANRDRGLPTISAVVSVYDGVTGQLRMLLDGQTVTARRTAAVSMLGLRLLHPAGPKHAVVIGTGTQAAFHVRALLELYPGLRVDVIGRSVDKARAFARSLAGDSGGDVRAAGQVDPAADLVITTTTSATPVYDQAPRADRLLIGVGAYRADLAEIGPHTLAGSHLYVDDLAGAQHEAGDYLQAGVDWARVVPLAGLLDAPPPAGAAVFKTVGSAAWDLAAARCALAQAGLA